MGLRGPKAKRKEVQWSPDFAYGVGLMVSDGNLSSDGRHLAFVSKDREQVENVKQCFAITANISQRLSNPSGSKPYYRLQWGDVVLYKFFVSIGLTPNKSLTIGALTIPRKYFFEFLRGVFDGDGCFYSYFDPRWKNSFMFYLDFVSASEAHIAWLQASGHELLGISGHRTANRSKTFFHLRYAKQDSLRLLERMYQSSSGLQLKTKRLKIERALRIVGKSLPNRTRR